MALEAQHEKAKPLGLEVSWPKTKVQVFGGLLDETVQFVHACGEDIEILKVLHILVAQFRMMAEDEGEKEPPGERRKRLAKQMWMALTVSLAYMVLGATLTWPSPAVSSLDKDNSTLVGTEIVFDAAQKDMTGSLLYLGSLFGSWIGGWMVSRLGRRLSMQLTGLPYTLGCVMIGLAPNTTLLLTGRLIQGVANGCMSVAGYAYVVELSDTSIRGMLTVLTNLGVTVGSLYTVAAGYALPWHYLSFVAVLPCVVFVIASFFLPESPSYLVIQGRRQSAIALLRKLRGNYVDIEAEVTQLEHMNPGGSGGWRGLLDKDILRRIGGGGDDFPLQ
ncbi:Sugar transporter ERD6-like 4 [Chionoecetes opilio]|uniref:Sugar transporter ERD6-like 4 n=1 Tax=Chionoecetes opilio TaxID=41210 RepID=A0A8J4XW69_CHIOP|nr:Sugar transporter ERD6-like 4 [Chionoecetes opilio]